MRGRTFAGVTGVAVAALALALPALGATPKQIYQDYADNGKLDTSYSRSDLQRVLHDSSVQGYGSPMIIIKVRHPKGDIKSETATPRRPAIVPVPPKKGLPFTGAELGLFTVVGLALVGSGVLLRLTGRKRTG